jgi:hypothetical protein
MYEDVVQRSMSERPEWLKVIIAFRTGYVWQENGEDGRTKI